MNRIYNASTPIHPHVYGQMKPFLKGLVGNPSSEHWAGAPFKAAIETARQKVASSLGCESHEIVFTNGGTESNRIKIVEVKNENWNYYRNK